jgi:peptidoglycan/LPS O-acetylase OafA/YrhL
VNARADRFPLFDSLRAIAALSVIGVHGAVSAGIYNTSTLRLFVSHLDVGVTIFYVISGFLLYRPFARARLEGRASPEAKAYAWRRFLRIVPAYWVALTIIAAVQLDHSEVFTLVDVPRYYGFLQVYDPGTAFKGIPQAWTLCVEVGFYVLLPLWALLMRRVPSGSDRAWLRGELLMLGGLFLASFAYKAIMVHQGAITDPSFGPFMLSIPAFLDQFALGMALAVLSVWFADPSRSRPRLLGLVERRPAVAWLCAAAAFTYVSIGTGFDPNAGKPLTVFQFFAEHYAFAVVAVAVVVPGVFGDPAQGVVRRILGNRVLLYLGLVSYGLYLWHSAVFEQLNRWGFGQVASETHPYAWYAAGLALTTLVATASYYAVERPALSLKGRVGARAPGPPDEALREPTAVASGGGG